MHLCAVGTLDICGLTFQEWSKNPFTTFYWHRGKDFFLLNFGFFRPVFKNKKFKIKVPLCIRPLFSAFVEIYSSEPRGTHAESSQTSTFPCAPGDAVI